MLKAIAGIIALMFIVGTIMSSCSGSDSTDTWDGDTRGECVVSGGVWNQTGSDPVTDGYCVLP